MGPALWLRNEDYFFGPTVPYLIPNNERPNLLLCGPRLRYAPLFLLLDKSHFSFLLPLDTPETIIEREAIIRQVQVSGGPIISLT